MLLNRLFILVIIILPVTSVVGQDSDRSQDEIAFDKVFDIYYDEEYDSALLLFERFLDDYPNSSLVPRAKYNIGYILREIGRGKESIPFFEDILNSNYDDKERFGGLMEQYTLYKHRSASQLAEIYLNTGDFMKAEKYIRLFDKKYKYEHFGGNEMMENEIYTAKSYARLYDGQGKSQKAINELLPYIFDNGLASNLTLQELLIGLLEKEYSDEEMSGFVKEAKNSLRMKDESTAYIDFIGTKIQVYEYQLFDIGNPEYRENLELKGGDSGHVDHPIPVYVDQSFRCKKKRAS